MTNTSDDKVLVLVDLYQRIEDQGVEEFDELDGGGQASLIKQMAIDFMQQISTQLDKDNDVLLLGLSGSEVTYLDAGSLDQVNAENTSDFYDDGFIQFAVSNLSKEDWSSNFTEISGGLDCVITAIGPHPNYEGIIRQGYGMGEIEEGLISDNDEEEFLNNEISVKLYKSYFGH